MRTCTHTSTCTHASHPLLRPERWSWSGTARRASRSAVWASLPAPDNFTIAALAGGDNHIKLPWQEALNSASVPLRVWHPAVSREHAADVTMRRFVFSFFHFVPLLYFLLFFLCCCRRNAFSSIWDSMWLGQQHLAFSSIECYRIGEVLLYWCLLFVTVNAIQCIAYVPRNIYEKFPWENYCVIMHVIQIFYRLYPGMVPEMLRLLC